MSKPKWNRVRVAGLLALTLTTTKAGDTNWPHYGQAGMGYHKGSTNYTWGNYELPHRIRWHDGYYGAELVRVELRTNTMQLQLCSDPINGFHRIMSQRRVLWVASAGPTNTTTTNEIVLLELDRYREWPNVAVTNCCAGVTVITSEAPNGWTRVKP